MPTIDRSLLLSDVTEELGPANTLSDSRINAIGESVISKVGDDDTFYPEVFCKTLRDAAVLNRQRAISAQGRGVKREKSYDREIEWFETVDSVDYWDQYLDSVGDVCILYGYNGLSSPAGLGFYAHVGPEIKVPDCDLVEDILGFDLDGD